MIYINPLAEYDFTAEEEAINLFDKICKRAAFLNEGMIEQKRYLSKVVMVEKHKEIEQSFLGSIWTEDGCKRLKDRKLGAFIKYKAEDMENQGWDKESIYVKQCEFVRDYTLLFLIKDFVKKKDVNVMIWPLEEIFKKKEHVAKIKSLLKINNFLNKDDTWEGETKTKNELAHIFQQLENLNITDQRKKPRNSRLISFYKAFGAGIKEKDLDNFKKCNLQNPPTHLNLLIEKFGKLGNI